MEPDLLSQRYGENNSRRNNLRYRSKKLAVGCGFLCLLSFSVSVIAILYIPRPGEYILGIVAFCFALWSFAYTLMIILTFSKIPISDNSVVLSQNSSQAFYLDRGNMDRPTLSTETLGTSVGLNIDSTGHGLGISSGFSSEGCQNEGNSIPNQFDLPPSYEDLFPSHQPILIVAGGNSTALVGNAADSMTSVAPEVVHVSFPTVV